MNAEEYAAVRAQVEHGLDVVDDGEMGKASFLTYANERLEGFEPSPGSPPGSPFAGSREFLSFPEFYQQQARGQDNPAASAIHYVCTRPIAYKGQARVQTDIELLKAAMAQVGVDEAFLSLHPAGHTGLVHPRHPSGLEGPAEGVAGRRALGDGEDTARRPVQPMGGMGPVVAEGMRAAMAIASSRSFASTRK